MPATIILRQRPKFGQSISVRLIWYSQFGFAPFDFLSLAALREMYLGAGFGSPKMQS